MKSRIGQVVELGKLATERGPVHATLRPLGDAWVLWIRRERSTEQRHLGVLSCTPRGYLFVSRRGRRTEATDHLKLIQRIVSSPR